MSDWRLTEVIAKWFEEQEWEERPKLDEESRTSSTGFSYTVGDYTFKCFFDAAEKPNFFKMYLYFLDTKVPTGRVPEVLKWINMVNPQYAVGTLHFIPDERVVRCYHGMDFENASFETQHITNMFKLMVSIMEYRLPQMLAICFGGKTAEEAFEIKQE